ncbi:hypothetical protein [Rhodococcus jostii]|uniref:hypothetical protein n=1 Tax=Rhodococcus jostii TaxID=132919 RepID=UPI001ED98195|nr:hypothetical protein [Rhodococcus jostii]
MGKIVQTEFDPRAALDEVGGKAWAHPGVTLRGDSPASQLLTSYLDTLASSLPRLSQSAVAAARNATLELLIGAVRPDTVDTPPRAAARLCATPSTGSSNRICSTST